MQSSNAEGRKVISRFHKYKIRHDEISKTKQNKERPKYFSTITILLLLLLLLLIYSCSSYAITWSYYQQELVEAYTSTAKSDPIKTEDEKQQKTTTDVSFGTSKLTDSNDSKFRQAPENETFSSCNVSRTFPLWISNYSDAIQSDLTHFMIMDKNPILKRRYAIERPFATCKYQAYRFSDHFPHFMQQFFRCWSFWKSFPNHQHVWLEPKPRGKLYRQAFGKEFTRGVYHLLPTANITIAKGVEEHYNVTGATNVEDNDSVSAKAKGPYFDPPFFEVANIQHMKSLKRVFLNGLGLLDPNSLPLSCNRTPRIALLNRERNNIGLKRSIINARELVGDLNKLYPDYNIELVTFEHKSFKEQADHMSQWDIVLSPYGAQETSQFFMRDCGGIIEIMPQKYFNPFFGYLAVTSGIDHAVIHHSNYDYEYDGIQKNNWVKFRDTDIFCPSRKAVKEALDVMIDRWRLCCGARTAAS